MPNCRSCGAKDPQVILSLGHLPLANALLKKSQLSQPEETYPLDLVFCPECTLVQITETVQPEKLFSEYLYFSSFSDTVLENAKTISNKMAELCQLSGDSLVVEIASNDGYLLKNYVEKGIPVLGIEPAGNIARVASGNGIPTLSKFFDQKVAEELIGQGVQADVIHANNVAAHVADLHGFIEGIATLLKPDGVAVIENHYVRDLIDQIEFDSIYHEHLCYYSATSMKNLFANYGLKMVDVEHLPIHGGSLRAYFQRDQGPCSFDKNQQVVAFLDNEIQWGVDDLMFYRKIKKKVERLRIELVDLLQRLKSEGNRIAGYGASAKSTTLMNYFGVGQELIDFVADRSTAKQGYFTPGTHLPIVEPEKLLTEKPDYVLMLAWNIKDEILTQQEAYRQQGGRFIVPIPEIAIL